MAALGIAARAVGFRKGMAEPNHDLLLDALSILLSNRWYWVIQGLIVTCAAASGWLLARASADTPAEPQLPRYASPARSPAPSYGTLPTSNNQFYDTAQVIALQAQVRAGRSNICELEARVRALSAALKIAEGNSAEVAALRADLRNSESLVLSLDTKLEALRSQARSREDTILIAEAKVARLSVALERADADVARFKAVRADANGSDAIIFSLDSKLEALRSQARSKDASISTLESEISSLTSALERSRNGQCDRCVAPPHVTTEKARGRWLRRQAETMNEEAGRILFDAHNPDLIGARARLRNEMRIDLHLQFRGPAVEYVKKYATSARDQGFDKIIFIVGKGLHSEDNVPKLRPLVLETLRSLGMEARVPPNNSGEIVVKLQRAD